MHMLLRLSRRLITAPLDVFENPVEILSVGMFVAKTPNPQMKPSYILKLSKLVWESTLHATLLTFVLTHSTRLLLKSAGVLDSSVQGGSPLDGPCGVSYL